MECKHHDVCGFTDEFDLGAGLCILHSHQPHKNQKAFDDALAMHCHMKGDVYHHMVFPGRVAFDRRTFIANVDFTGATFTEDATFMETTFGKGVYFTGVTFKGTYFVRTTFSEGADFTGATFTEDTYFAGAIFPEGVDFSKAIFTKSVNFSWATFTKDANFAGAVFLGEGVFIEPRFPGGSITFQLSRFSGRLLFTGGRQPNLLVFQEATAVDFRDLWLGSPESLSFRQADFRTCRFLNTDLRKAELTGVHWPQKRARWLGGTRRVVYDEMAPLSDEPYPWDQLERLYRELKQNYEDRRNYAHAGDFHYGEKEIQRWNPATPRSLKFFLWLYWIISGYGERYLKPLCWAIGLWALATVGYLLLRLPPAKDAVVPTLALADPVSWGHAVLYSLQVMLFFRPQDYVLSTVGAKTIYTLQSLLGPLFLGLFALAVRQRLKH